MSSSRAALHGCQVPRVRLVPSFHWSHADDAAFLASSYGLTPDEWQHSVLEAWLGERRSGKWAAGRCGLAVPRQNGKNGVIEVRELYGMVALGEKFLHTAHEVKTARKAFMRLASFFENERKFPELAAMVKGIRKTNGQEAIVLTNGGSVEFVARSRGSGRGYTVDVLVIDEAQELTDEQLEALLPTISAAPLGNPQTIYTGTPPGPGSPGDVFTRTRDLGVKGKDKRLSWHEWSVDGAVNIHDRSYWAATNPALGKRLNVTVIEDELAAMSEDGFARERLGRWASASSAAWSVVDEGAWSAIGVTDPPATGRVSYGVKFSLDGSRVALAVAQRDEDGPVHVEVIDEQPMSLGTAWLVDWLAERWRHAAAIVIDGKSGAGSLVNDLRERGVRSSALMTPTADQVITAHAGLLNAITSGTVTRFDDPGQAVLTAAAAGAGKRAIGTAGGWGWKPVGEADVTPLEAVTMAHFGAVGVKARKVRTGEAMFQ